jgi:hypothetical protein
MNRPCSVKRHLKHGAIPPKRLPNEYQFGSLCLTGGEWFLKHKGCVFILSERSAVSAIAHSELLKK